MRRGKALHVIFVVVLAVGVSASAVAQRRGGGPYVVSFDGFGPVKVGMTVSQASRALGVPLVRDEVYEEDCHYFSPKRGFKDVSFMVIKGRIARVDVFEKGYTTDRGAKVGDTEAQIMRLYRGMVKVSQHPYVDGHYLTVRQKGGRRSMIFETEGKRVTSFRAGKTLEVGYIEGCS